MVLENYTIKRERGKSIEERAKCINNREEIGHMEMTETTFPWTLTYDEVDYIIEGRLEILIDGRKVVGEAGDVILMPKGSKIQFSAPKYAKFMYFVSQ